MSEEEKIKNFSIKTIEKKFCEIFYHVLSNLTSYSHKESGAFSISDIDTYIPQISKAKSIQEKNEQDIGDFLRLKKILKLEETKLYQDIQDAIYSEIQLENVYNLYSSIVENKLEKYEEKLKELTNKKVKLETQKTKKQKSEKNQKKH